MGNKKDSLIPAYMLLQRDDNQTLRDCFRAAISSNYNSPSLERDSRRATIENGFRYVCSPLDREAHRCKQYEFKWPKIKTREDMLRCEPLPYRNLRWLSRGVSKIEQTRKRSLSDKI